MKLLLRKLWLRYNFKKNRKIQLKKLRLLNSFGINNYICPGVSFSSPENISFGDHVWIGHNVRFDGRGGIIIGCGCIIARDAEFITSNHNFQSDDLTEIPYDSRFISKPIVIGENVWTGIRCIILPGVTIGEGAVIGACSVVTKDIPALAIAAGNPAKVIRYRDKEQYYRLKAKGKIYLKENYNYDISDAHLK